MTSAAAHVVVELTGEHTTGMTVTDFTERSGPRSTRVGLTLDRARFWELITDALVTIGEPS